MISSPGRNMRWKVLPRRIVVPESRNAWGVMPLTVPYVPQGMNTGVSTTPRRVVSRPRRAAPSVARTSNIAGLVAFAEHGIAVAEEPVALFYRLVVGPPHGFNAGKRRHQHQQRGFRQVEVRYQGVHDLEAIARA